MKVAVSIAVWAGALFSIWIWLLSPDLSIPYGVEIAVYSAALIHLLALMPVLFFRFSNPRRTAYMRKFSRIYSPDGKHPAEISYTWTPLAQISKSMQLAAIAGEDPLFPRHYGFDWDSILSAVEHNRTATHKRGGSTISQQLAKNLFLWSAPSFIRKLIEAYLTVLIEATWSKSRILEVYLNVAQFGQTLFGVQEASHRYFSLAPGQLSDKQAALLAAILPNPLLEFHPESPGHRVRYRQVMIMKIMKTFGPEYLELL